MALVLSTPRIVAAAALAAVTGWFLVPPPQPPAALVQPRGDAWVLPVLPRAADQTTLAATVLSAPYWGVTAPAAAAAAGGAPVDNRWRIAATYGKGSQRGLLVEFSAPGRSPAFLKTGDTLPSGHRIVRIDDAEVCVQIGSRQYKLGVERSAN
jgi:hypothetical protein